MKKLILIPAAMMLCAGVYAQGTITVQNSTSTLLTSSTGVAVAGPVGGGTFKVELFYQADSGGAAPAAINATGALGNWLPTQYGVFTLTPANSPTYGVFDPGIATLTGITAGANVWLDVVAWNNNSASLAAAVTGSSLIGFSTVWANTTGGVGSPPSSPSPIIGTPSQFTGLQLQPVPEPATIALAGLGAASLLLFRRRK